MGWTTTGRLELARRALAHQRRTFTEHGLRRAALRRMAKSADLGLVEVRRHTPEVLSTPARTRA